VRQSPIPDAASDAALALTALGWILSDGVRADRFLALTGLTPADLRGGLGERGTLAAIMGFLMAHESDLVSCAAAIDSDPAALAAAADRLEA
jgi:Protein of unknown function (DUF3572)